MFGMGMGEIILIAVVALLVLGPERLPGAAKAIGKGIRDLRSQTKGLQETIEKDTQIGEAVRELRGALRGDPETLYKRATGEDFHDTNESAQDKEDESPDTSVSADTHEESPETGHDKKDEELDQVAANSNANEADKVPLITTPPGATPVGEEPPDDDSNHG